jgi:SAM-dependent methyltransferase
VPTADAPVPRSRNEQKTESAARRIVGMASQRRTSLGRVLDVGCGTGQLLVAARSSATSLVGIDIDTDALAVARRALPDATLLAGSVDELPFEAGTFDTIFFCDVIEHLNNPVAPLATLRQLLAGGGLLVVTTPNANALMRVLLRDGWFGLSDEGHILFFTAFTLGHVLRKTGFRSVSVRTIGGFGKPVLDAAFELFSNGGTLLAFARAEDAR